MSKTGAPRKAFNLNALRAQQADARGAKYVDFEITPEDSTETLTFSCLRRTWWPVKFLVAIEDLDGDVAVLRELMGGDQFEQLIEAGLDFSDMKAIFKEVMGVDADTDGDGGASLGESSGSSES